MVYSGLQHYCLKLLTMFIIGLFFSLVQASDNCSSFYNPCESNSGVYLDCFSRRVTGKREFRCEWTEPSTSRKMYTLIIQQGTYCSQYKNLTEKSQTLKIYEKKNFTASLLVDKNCRRATFTGLPQSLIRCGPPHEVSFSRRSGTLDMGVDWLQQEKSAIQSYSVRFKAEGDLLWRKLSLTDPRSRVDDLNPDLTYVAQIKCDFTNKCSQCPWSHTYTIPPELRMRPVLTSLKDVDNTVTGGTRLVSLTWKNAAKEMADGYNVIIRKASGEPPSEHLNTTDTKITFNLSSSAYTVNISAFNSVSVSQDLELTIQRREDVIDSEDAKLNVTVHSNTSFTVYWRPHLLTHVCYSVEWSQKHQKTAYKSFFENVQSYKQVDFEKPLEPFKRYRLYLHTRPNRETCNLKHINNGESTYGRRHFYYMEGSPSAPTNISCLSMTSTSVVLQWSPIPEDDLRGFLLGYNIYYKEYNRGAQTAEKNLTIDAVFTSYELEDLKTGTGYQVQISAFTRVGAGDRSITSFCKTYNRDKSIDIVIIIIFVALITLLLIASPVFKRTKMILWPSIPNPENSSAIRKIERSCEVELMESLKTLTVEEWDTNSLQMIEEAIALTSLPALFTTEERADSPEMELEWTQNVPNDLTDTEQRGLPEPQTIFNGGYTTMEMFQQNVMPPCGPAIAKDMVPTERELDDVGVPKPGLEYVRQLCSSPAFDMSTTL